MVPGSVLGLAVRRTTSDRLTIRFSRRTSPATLRSFYDTWYRPDLMAVVAVGDFNKSTVEALIKRYLGAIPPATNPKPRPLYPVPAPRQHAGFHQQRQRGDPIHHSPALQAAQANQHHRRHATGSTSSSSCSAAMFNDRFSEITQKPNPPFINAYAAQGDLVRSAESFSLTAIVADNGIQRGLNALLTEGERVKRFGFLQSELDRAKKDLQRRIEQAYAEREKTNSSVYAAAYVSAFLAVGAVDEHRVRSGCRQPIPADASRSLK